METAKQFNTRLIMQGEIGIYQGLDCMEITLKTPTPTSCTVLTLFGIEKKIAVMAHVDDYVSIEHLFHFLSEKMQSKYQCSLKSLHFEAKVFGGSENSFSKQQQETIVKILNTYDTIKWEKLKTDSIERPQVTMSATTGKVSFLFDKDKNLRLEYLQMREYYFFNKFFLDKKYEHMNGNDIPYFEVGLAKRSEFDLPKFEMKNLNQESINAALELEDTKKISLPIVFFQRNPVAQKESCIITLTNLLNQYKENSLKSSMQTLKFSLLLRQSCISEKYIKITEYMFGCRCPLNIDLHEKGATSGTALDVARKFKNEKAIKLLEPILQNPNL